MRRTGKHHPRARRSSPAGGADSHVRFRSYIPLALPPASVASAPRCVAPEPLVAAVRSRPAASRAPYLALLGSVILCVIAIVYIVGHGERGARALAPAPTPAAAGVVAIVPSVGSAVLTAGAAPEIAQGLADHELARAERSEVANALEIGDLRRAADVATRAVAHDPAEADGWLLLAAAEIELGHREAVNHALASCAARATHGPRGECLALMQPNGPR